MAYDGITALLGGWESFELTGVQREPAGKTDPVPRIVLELRPMPNYPKRCNRCGEVVVEIHRRVSAGIAMPPSSSKCPRQEPALGGTRPRARGAASAVTLLGPAGVRASRPW